RELVGLEAFTEASAVQTLAALGLLPSADPEAPVSGLALLAVPVRAVKSGIIQDPELLDILQAVTDVILQEELITPEQVEEVLLPPPPSGS
ncbi:MAG: hypothetical protein HY335_05675, partial [Deinococcus sp.]|nr:hypothetical protein [Deinococcus sp.]